MTPPRDVPPCPDGSFAGGVCIGLLLVAPLWAVLIWAVVQWVTG